MSFKFLLPTGSFIHVICSSPYSRGNMRKSKQKNQSKFVAIFNFGYEYEDKLEDVYIALEIIL